MEKIGIVLVNYNGFKDTVECIESINRIDDIDYEIIVVDNASTDSSYEKLKNANFLNCTVIEAEHNLGFSAGNNIGIKYAKEIGCNYILLLNNDTYVEKDFLSCFLECERKYDNNAAITGKILYADNKSIIWYAGGDVNRLTGRTVHYGIHEPDDGKYDDEKIVTFISGCCIFFPVRIIDTVGMMDERYFLYCEDLDYCCCIRSHGYKLIYEPKAVIYHKINSSTRKIPHMEAYYTIRNKRYVLKKYFKGFQYIIASAYNYLEETKRILKSEYQIETVKQARRDFRKGFIGQKVDIA